MVVITGAGISTNSGIPDYRGPQGSYRMGHKPITHQEFVGDVNYRKRYWARSIMGWEVFSKANPNDAHYALKQLEDLNKLQTIVTQNVDRLHQRAGSKRVVDLHGRNDLVVCLQCKHNLPRDAFQKELIGSNSVFYNFLQDKIKTFKIEQERKYSGHNETEKNLNLLMRADGDMELGITDFSEFHLPKCPCCHSQLMKPDVVFFGDNVPAERVQTIYQQIEKCDSVLVIGTSLEVFSAFRFVNRANDLQKPIAIINHGETRAERKMMSNIVYKSDENCAELLKIAVDRL